MCHCSHSLLFLTDILLLLQMFNFAACVHHAQCGSQNSGYFYTNNYKLLVYLNFRHLIVLNSVQALFMNKRQPEEM